MEDRASAEEATRAIRADSKALGEATKGSKVGREAKVGLAGTKVSREDRVDQVASWVRVVKVAKVVLGTRVDSEDRVDLEDKVDRVVSGVDSISHISNLLLPTRTRTTVNPTPISRDLTKEARAAVGV